jgi:hypothetical protein
MDLAAIKQTAARPDRASVWLGAAVALVVGLPVLL